MGLVRRPPPRHQHAQVKARSIRPLPNSLPCGFSSMGDAALPPLGPEEHGGALPNRGDGQQAPPRGTRPDRPTSDSNPKGPRHPHHSHHDLPPTAMTDDIPSIPRLPAPHLVLDAPTARRGGPCHPLEDDEEEGPPKGPVHPTPRKPRSAQGWDRRMANTLFALVWGRPERGHQEGDPTHEGDPFPGPSILIDRGETRRR
jgi:hypothetical protein